MKYASIAWRNLNFDLRHNFKRTIIDEWILRVNLFKSLIKTTGTLSKRT